MATRRRDFLRSSLLLPGLASLSADTPPATDPVYTDLRQDGQTGHSGLLFSQVGYPSDQPVRVILRAPARDSLSEFANCALLPAGDERRHRTALTYWGSCWSTHWWVADFGTIAGEGEWTVEAEDQGRVIFREDGLRVAEDILWRETYYWATVDMLRKRSYFTKVGSGWQDAGALWVESPAQSAMTICLADVAATDGDWMTDDYREELYTQLQVGADYLVLTAEKSAALGNPPGSMVHDVIGHEEYVLPNDTIKAVVALYKTIAVLPDSFAGKKEVYQRTADRSLDYLLNVARPIGDQGLARRQRGLAEDAPIPPDEWPTRDLNFLCWACLEKYRNEDQSYKARCVNFARQLMDRQITKEEPEAGYYGHFREYESVGHSQKSWTHSILESGEKRFGTDIGALFPNYLIPLCDMLQLWPDHEDAGRWRSTLRDFAESFLIPTCKLNPFSLVPLGIFGEEGPLWFVGPFHGTNSIYGYTANLACRLYELFQLEDLRAIAAGNLQWIAGLNSGITRENIAMGSVIYTTEVPEGIALPASMICRVGRRWAGTWFQTKGVVCNGFSVGPQFKMDIEPSREVDAPSSFTDEDWIPHSAGFLTGLMGWKMG
jgi:hypothetical protein